MALFKTDPNKLPSAFAMAGVGMRLKLDRNSHTVEDMSSTRFPIAGAHAEVTRGEDVEKRFTGTRMAAGVAAGLVFLPLAAFALVKKRDGHVYLTITSGDEVSAIVVPLLVGKEPKARQFAAEFNNWSAKLLASV